MTRLTFVVQRYGVDVAGGAELLCRQLATRLAGRGHQVSVVTSCAMSYVDWANEYQPGISELDGVVVHRLATAAPRSPDHFGPLNTRVVWGGRPVPLYLQQAWMAAQGPDLPGLAPWLVEHTGDGDIVAFFTYLYATTWMGLPAVAGRVPTILHPTAHDEPPFHLPLFDVALRLPDGYAFSSEEERALVRRRLPRLTHSSVVGIGFDEPEAGDAGAFRAAHGLGADPYLLYVGRVDAAKGADELLDFFGAYRRRRPGRLKLVVVGQAGQALGNHPDVVFTGFVDEPAKRGAIEGSAAVVQPSYFESFSMVLAETWTQGKASLVQGHCDVLVGHARRSGGAIPYKGFAEFEAGVDLLLSTPELAEALGDKGRRYVQANFSWDAVLDRYEELVASVRRTAPVMQRAR